MIGLWSQDYCVGQSAMSVTHPHEILEAAIEGGSVEIVSRLLSLRRLQVRRHSGRQIEI
jgi:hypothetical protein